ncbi:titin homolog isoform X1 [Dermacentor silvarum]|uniref:titin homolog isoform X1 n=1 Tax=Dermacentor silvarum TaxID=543639 RepID=UPI002101652F|nr:titin homolog isoform X1 [Dermacentor silvarum]
MTPTIPEARPLLEPDTGTHGVPAEKQATEGASLSYAQSETAALEETRHKDRESIGERLAIQHHTPEADTKEVKLATASVAAVKEEIAIHQVAQKTAQPLAQVTMPDALVVAMDKKSGSVISVTEEQVTEIPDALSDMTPATTGTVQWVTDDAKFKKLQHPTTDKAPEHEFTPLTEQQITEMLQIWTEDQLLLKPSHATAVTESRSMSPTERAQRQQGLQALEVPGIEVRSAGDFSSEGAAVLVDVEDVDEEHEYHEEVREKRSTSIASMLRESPATIMAQLNVASSKPESPAEREGEAVLEPRFHTPNSEEELDKAMIAGAITDLSTLPEEVTKSLTDITEATITGPLPALRQSSAPDLQGFQEREPETAALKAHDQIAEVSTADAVAEKPLPATLAERPSSGQALEPPSEDATLSSAPSAYIDTTPYMAACPVEPAPIVARPEVAGLLQENIVVKAGPRVEPPMSVSTAAGKEEREPEPAVEPAPIVERPEMVGLLQEGIVAKAPPQVEAPMYLTRSTAEAEKLPEPAVQPAVNVERPEVARFLQEDITAKAPPEVEAPVSITTATAEGERKHEPAVKRGLIVERPEVAGLLQERITTTTPPKVEAPVYLTTGTAETGHKPEPVVEPAPIVERPEVAGLLQEDGSAKAPPEVEAPVSITTTTAEGERIHEPAVEPAPIVEQPEVAGLLQERIATTTPPEVEAPVDLTTGTAETGHKPEPVVEPAPIVERPEVAGLLHEESAAKAPPEVGATVSITTATAECERKHEPAVEPALIVQRSEVAGLLQEDIAAKATPEVEAPVYLMAATTEAEKELAPEVEPALILERQEVVGLLHEDIAANVPAEGEGPAEKELAPAVGPTGTAEAEKEPETAVEPALIVERPKVAGLLQEYIFAKVPPKVMAPVHITTATAEGERKQETAAPKMSDEITSVITQEPQQATIPEKPPAIEHLGEENLKPPSEGVIAPAAPSLYVKTTVAYPLEQARIVARPEMVGQLQEIPEVATEPTKMKLLALTILNPQEPVEAPNAATLVEEALPLAIATDSRLAIEHKPVEQTCGEAAPFVRQYAEESTLPAIVAVDAKRRESFTRKLSETAVAVVEEAQPLAIATDSRLAIEQKPVEQTYAEAAPFVRKYAEGRALPAIAAVDATGPESFTRKLSETAVAVVLEKLPYSEFMPILETHPKEAPLSIISQQSPAPSDVLPETHEEMPLPQVLPKSPADQAAAATFAPTEPEEILATKANMVCARDVLDEEQLRKVVEESMSLLKKPVEAVPTFSQVIATTYEIVPMADETRVQTAEEAVPEILPVSLPGISVVQAHTEMSRAGDTQLAIPEIEQAPAVTTEMQELRLTPVSARAEEPIEKLSQGIPAMPAVEPHSGLASQLSQVEPTSLAVAGAKGSLAVAKLAAPHTQPSAAKPELTEQPQKSLAKEEQLPFLPSPEPTTTAASLDIAEAALQSAIKVVEEKVREAAAAAERDAKKVEEEKEAASVTAVSAPPIEVVESVSAIPGIEPTQPVGQPLSGLIDDMRAEAPGVSESELAIAEALRASREEARMREEQRRALVQGIVAEAVRPQLEQHEAEVVSLESLARPLISEREMDQAQISGTVLPPSETKTYAEFQKSLKASSATTVPRTAAVALRRSTPDHAVAVPDAEPSKGHADIGESVTVIEPALQRQLGEKDKEEIRELAVAAVMVAAASAVVNAQQQREISALQEPSETGSMVSAPSEIPIASTVSREIRQKITGELEMLPSASRTALVAVLAAQPPRETDVPNAIAGPPSTTSTSGSTEDAGRLRRDSSRDRSEDFRVPETLVPALDDEIHVPRPTSFNVPVINIQYNFHFPQPGSPGAPGRQSPPSPEQSMAAQVLQGALAQQGMAGHIPGRHILSPEQAALREMTERLNRVALHGSEPYTGRQSPGRGTMFRPLPRKPVPPVPPLLPPGDDMTAQERKRVCGFRFIVCLLAFLMIVFILLYCLGLIGNKRYFMYYG